MTNYLRPDEMATNAEINRFEKRNEDIKSVIKTASQIGLGLGGATIASKISPFLSPYLTEDLALKGISKVAPKVGDFLKSGMSQGLTLKSGLDFLKENMAQKTKAENKTQNTNILDQYSPELREFIEERINSGKSPTYAAGVALETDKFKDLIKKIVKDHKLDNVFGFHNLIKSLYGNGIEENQSLTDQQNSQEEDPIIAQYKNIMSM